MLSLNIYNISNITPFYNFKLIVEIKRHTFTMYPFVTIEQKNLVQFLLQQLSSLNPKKIQIESSTLLNA